MAVKLKELHFRSEKIGFSAKQSVLRRLIDGIRRKLVAAVYLRASAIGQLSSPELLD